jgi:hypothetical protein
MVEVQTDLSRKMKQRASRERSQRLSREERAGSSYVLTGSGFWVNRGSPSNALPNAVWTTRGRDGDVKARSSLDSRVSLLVGRYTNEMPLSRSDLICTKLLLASCREEATSRSISQPRLYNVCSNSQAPFNSSTSFWVASVDLGRGFLGTPPRPFST